MALHRCPGMDVRFWKPKDIFDLRCPHCSATIEFWKDDPNRTCPGCGTSVSNPHIDLGCAKWCQYAEECLGVVPDAGVVEVPVIERLTALLNRSLRNYPYALQRARGVCAQTEALLHESEGDPRIIKSAALVLGSLLQNENGGEPNFRLANTFETPDRLKALLAEAGIEETSAEQVYHLVDAVISGQTQDTPEFTVVWKALQHGQENIAQPI